MPNSVPLLVGAIARDCTIRTGFSRSVCCVSTQCCSVSPGSFPGRKRMREKLWREFFSDPSQWWDHRSEKVNQKYPDFKHKKTQQALWIIDNLTPPWAESELAAIAPGLLQSHSFSWNVRLRNLVKAGDDKMTLKLFQQMQREDMIPDKFTFLPVLNACSALRSLEEGRRVHEQIIRRGCESNVYVANCLVDMYAKCGSIEDAWRVFNKMQEHNVVSWNAIIGGYVKSGQGLKAMELFKKMQQEGVEPNAVTFVGVLNACASVPALIEEGKYVHGQIIQRGCESDIYVATCLVHMYARCGSIDDAWNVFNKLRERNVVCWSAIITGYVKSGKGLKAIELFQTMREEGVEPNAITFARVLNACASVPALEEGRHVHEQIIQRGCVSDVYVANCLVDMYAKCGSIEDAWSVFEKMQERDVVSWNTIIGGYVNSKRELKAMELFQKMQQEGMEPDPVTFVGVLNACASLPALQEGKRIHQQIIQKGCESHVYIANALIDMYAKCGSIDNAWSVFNKLRVFDVVSWNAMIGGFVKSEKGLRAIELFWKMQQEGVEPDSITFIVVLNACASVAALEEGRRVHGQIIERECESDVNVANCLVDMYAKCGSIEDAWSVFDKMRQRDMVSWSAMIGGYAMHGHSKKAIGLFKRIVKDGMELDAVSFICLLSACSHGGLVKEGLRYFKSMLSCYGIVPTTEHYACMVSLLGRAGRVEEAGEMTRRMPTERNGSVWKSLLGACIIHGNIEMAERAAKRCWELDPGDASAHVLLSNIYAAALSWDTIGATDNKGWTKTG